MSACSGIRVYEDNTGIVGLDSVPPGVVQTVDW